MPDGVICDGCGKSAALVRNTSGWLELPPLWYERLVGGRLEHACCRKCCDKLLEQEFIRRWSEVCEVSPSWSVMSGITTL